MFKRNVDYENTNGDIKLWKIQSVDTVKYSRDLAREKILNTDFENVIDDQVRSIAKTGATHIALGTPYDAEFIPFLSKWVKASRKYGLNIWFRGNLSGWEGWFGYPLISSEEHTEMIKLFIIENGDLFNNGDIFSSCTECENGVLGDPRKTGKIYEFRKFLIDEYNTSSEAFKVIGKDVYANYNSMNGDVAELIMDKDTTIELGGIVVIDHYVTEPKELVSDIKYIANKSGGRIVLGEFGAPIPDIHGRFDETKQAEWISELLSGVANIEEVIGVNYWTSFGGSTEIWNENYTAKSAVDILNKYYSPNIVKGVVKNETGKKLNNVDVSSCSLHNYTNDMGVFVIPYIEDVCFIKINAEGYFPEVVQDTSADNVEVILIKRQKDIFYKIKIILRGIIENINDII